MSCRELASGVLLLLTITGAALGCATQVSESEPEAETGSALVGGTVTSLRPEVGRVNGTCTATLIHPRYVITAAHCINATTLQPSSSPPTMMFSIGSESYLVDRMHGFGYFRLQYTGSGDRTTDVALLRLATAVPASTAQPARLADAPPVLEAQATLFGFGCTNRDQSAAGAGTKRFFTFAYGSSTSALCQGDSGGPAFIGGPEDIGELWGINSDYTGSGSFSTWSDLFGDVTFFKPQIEQLIRQWEGSDLEYGFSRSGRTYRTLFKSSTDACRTACQSDPRCRAFTYTALGAACALKDAAPPMVSAAAGSSTVSGLPTVVSPNLTFAGAGNLTLTGVTTAERCAAECGRRRTCIQWRWASESCTLSDAEAPLTTCTNCAAGTKKQTRELNVNRAGHDYASANLSDPVLCELACAFDARCKAYTHVAAGVVGLQAKCSLKDARGTPASLTGATSGVKLGLAVNTDRPGSAYASFSLPDPTPELCQSECAEDAACQAWVFSPERSGSAPARCSLKNSVPKAYSTDGLVSGVYSDGWVLAANVDNFGGDYRSFTPSPASPDTCQSTCSNERSTRGCSKWTFVPAAEGRSARCHLKNGSTVIKDTTNIVSGLRGLEFYR